MSTWELGEDRSLPRALLEAVPQTSRAITTAGLALAASFAMLALIPLSSFREIAFALAVGILIDAFIIRSIMVPALLSLVGPFSAWPGPGLQRRRDRPEDVMSLTAG